MSLWQLIFDLLFPPRCPFCRGLLPAGSTEGAALLPWDCDRASLAGVLCPRCAAVLSWLRACCPCCARPRAFPEEEKEDRCAFCRTFDLAFNHCCALGSYSGLLRQALHRFKYGGEKALAAPLGLLLSSRLLTMPWFSAVEMLVPVPLARARLRARGYNQAALLAERVGRELGLPVLPLLQRTRDTDSQTGLDRNQRWENMRGGFRCMEKNLTGRHLLLVDDVLTSGATAHAASLALKERGAACVSVAVIAR